MDWLQAAILSAQERTGILPTLAEAPRLEPHLHQTFRCLSLIPTVVQTVPLTTTHVFQVRGQAFGPSTTASAALRSIIHAEGGPEFWHLS